MNTQDYQDFTDALRRNLERDPRVIGLLAAGTTPQSKREGL